MKLDLTPKETQRILFMREVKERGLKGRLIIYICLPMVAMLLAVMLVPETSSLLGALLLMVVILAAAFAGMIPAVMFSRSIDRIVKTKLSAVLELTEKETLRTLEHRYNNGPGASTRMLKKLAPLAVGFPVAIATDWWNVPQLAGALIMVAVMVPACIPVIREINAGTRYAKEQFKLYQGS